MPSIARSSRSLSRTTTMKDRTRLLFPYNLAISHCFISSREKTTRRRGLCRASVIGTKVLPKEPVPPVIRMDALVSTWTPPPLRIRHQRRASCTGEPPPQRDVRQPEQQPDHRAANGDPGPFGSRPYFGRYGAVDEVIRIVSLNVGHHLVIDLLLGQVRNSLPQLHRVRVCHLPIEIVETAVCRTYIR